MGNLPDDVATIPTPAGDSLTYDTYLQLAELLQLQTPQTEPREHDEMLFIIVHQVYELWFKQILHEIDAAEKALSSQAIMPFLKCMDRVGVIQKVLNQQVDVLETMTPNDFNRFRARLNPASGFQSFQFRILEFKLGAKRRPYLRFFRDKPDIRSRLEDALQAPTLFDRFLSLLEHRGFAVPDTILMRDRSQAYTGDDRIVELLANIYLHPTTDYELYLACEKLMDLDENVLLWRYRHIAMVERMIGRHPGTGGSSGVGYLATTLTLRFFPDLWAVRDRLGQVQSSSSEGGLASPPPAVAGN